MSNINEDRPAADVQADITCPEYEVPAEGWCCEYYSPGSGCMAAILKLAADGPVFGEPAYCEWTDENDYLNSCDIYGEEEMIALRRRKRLDTSSSPVDLFGFPNPDYRPPKAEGAAPKPAVAEPTSPPSPTPAVPPPRRDPEPTEDRPMPAGLTEEAIASFDAAGIEAQFTVPDLGEVWLVSERTGQDRFELTARDLAGLARVVTVFDGARVVSIEKAPRMAPA